MSTKQFAHLHVHTDYSALDGASKISSLVDEVARLGQPAVAITDHGNTQGAYELWKTATSQGINPIIGQEFYVAPGGTSRHGRERVFFGDTKGEDKIERSNDVSGGGAYTHMTMWAESNEGMHNLFKMSSYAFLEGRFGMNHAPRIDDELIAEYGKGIIATTGCPSGEIQTRLRLGQWDKAVEYAAKMQDILGKDSYFLELMDHGLHIEKIVREDLLKLSDYLNIPKVATNDTHYTRKEDAANHDHLLCIQTGSTIDSEKRFRFDGDGYYIKSAEEMRTLFRDFPDACDNTLAIAERCHVEFVEGVDLMPKADVPSGMTDGEFLEKEVIRLIPERVRGWGNFTEEKKEEYYQRGKYECSIIKQMGFSSYFLVVGDFVQWAKDQDIAVGPGRGCLAPDTKVLTPDGFKKIKDIKVGDIVFDQNGEQVEVPYVFEHDSDEKLVRINVSSEHGNSMTQDHKVLARKMQEFKTQWYRADEIQVGDELVMPHRSGTYSSPVPISDRDTEYIYYRVQSIEYIENDSKKIYDFTVPTTNSYVTDSYVVHNSAGGCLVAYTMSITELDPIKHNLIFERFLNPERVSMPDVDIDFDDKRRHEVIAYVTEKYGEDKVAQIVTFGLIKAKAALKDASRILDNPYAVGDILSKKMPEMVMGKTMTLKGVFDPEDERYPEAQEFRDTIDKGTGSFSSDTFKEAVEVARGLEGYIRQTGIHAAGVIMSSKPLIETIPLMLPKPKPQSKKKKKETDAEGDEVQNIITTVTQFDYPTCESLGLLKMDFLGLRNLTIITDAFSYIKENHGISMKMEDLIHSDLDDVQTYKTLQRGDSLGIFQLDGCLAGDTLVSGRKISELYENWVKGEGIKTTVSVDLAEGEKRHNKVLNVIQSGVKPVYRLTSKSGRMIEATADHRFMTSNGWKKLGDIDIEKDEVIVDNSDEECEAYKKVSSENMQGEKNPMFGKTAPLEIKGFMRHLDKMKIDAFQEQHGIMLDVVQESEFAEMQFKYQDLIAGECRPSLPKTASFESIVSIEYVNEQMTYDISMEAPLNNFLANGFMVHNSGMRSLLKSLRPTEFNDISAVLALYRPGPMGVNAHMDYADRKNGRKPIIPIHPELEEPLHEILGETYELVVFQEQIMQIAQTVAGYSLGSADLLRRAMGKKKKEEMDKQYDVFLGGMKSRGYSKEAFEALWNVLLPFADYAFNKSHSDGYALLSYVTAYLKTHYPSEYMAALLTSVGDKPDQTAVYLNECRKMGIQVLPPDIRKSKRNYDPQGNKIVFGLGSIRGLGEGTVEGIVNSRTDHSYDSIDSLLETFPADTLNKKVFDGLIHSGALDNYGYSRRALEKDLISSLAAAKTVREEKDEGSLSLFDAYEVELPPVVINDIPEYTKKEKLALERHMLGLYVSDHPLSNMGEVLERSAQKNIAEIHAGDFSEGETTRIAGVITQVENKTTKKGDPMQIVTVEDMTGDMTVLVFGGTIKSQGYLQRDSICQITGTLRQREEEDVAMMAKSFSEIEIDETTGKVPFWLKFSSPQITTDSTQELQRVLSRYPGDTPVFMSIREPYGKVYNMRVGNDILVNPSPGLAQLLMELFGSQVFGKWNS